MRTRRAGGVSLTERQLDVMALLARGAPNRVIACAPGIGVRTVKPALDLRRAPFEAMP